MAEKLSVGTGSGEPDLLHGAAAQGRHAAAAGGGPASFPSGGKNDKPGAPLSNTAPANCIEVSSEPRILRFGVDSLYLSYQGTLAREWVGRLEGLKLAAQSLDDREQALAQARIREHLFEVLGRGRGRFAYVLRDNAFQVQLTGPESVSLPMAYAQVGSELLTAVGFEEGERRLRFVCNSLGRVLGEANLSRVDLFVDFLCDESIDSWPVGAWVTRAHKIDRHHVQRQFSGWSIGLGGVVGARLYDKTMEFEKSGKDYLKPLWAAQGWQEGQTVWRLEFELKREALAEVGVRVISDLRSNLCGLWAYATGSWLRLTLPNPADATQTRWPTHPLWAGLSALDWGNPSAPSLARVRVERLPADEALFVNGLGGITSFMAREGITDLGEGFGEFLVQADRFHEHRARSGAPGSRTTSPAR